MPSQHWIIPLLANTTTHLKMSQQITDFEIEENQKITNHM
jgi:hypothetical protein